LQRNLKFDAMKKLTFLFMLFAVVNLQACTGNAENSKTETTEGQVVKLTAESFQKLVWDYKSNPQQWVFKGDQPVIIDFYADWCRPCKMIAPILAEISQEYKGKVRIYKVNTDEQRELASLFNISSIPAVLYVPMTGKPQMSVGAQQKAGYVEMIKTILKVQ
jgi:thioredoxin